MTDLEICECIAGIDGKEYVSTTDSVYVIGELFGKEYKELYNPIASKSMCFDLMVKYKVGFLPFKDCYESVIMSNDGESSFTASDSTPQRAICLAVIKKHEVEQND